MGSYEQRGKGNTWRLVAELGYDAQGKRDRRTKTITIDDPALLRAPVRLKKHLEAELLNFETECKAGTYITPGKLTFEALVEDWKKTHVEIDLEEKTKENYIYQMNRRILPFFREKRIDQITTKHCKDYLVYLTKPEARLDGQNKPLGSATIVYNYRILRSLFNYAVEMKFLSVSPMTGVKKPKEDDVREMQYYDEKEIELLFTALEKEPLHLRVMIMLAVTTGLRRGEMAGLEWNCIDLEAGVLEVRQSIPKLMKGNPVIKKPKNKKSIRKLALSPSVVEELKLFHKEWRKERMQIEDKWEDGKYEFLFCNPNGKPYDPQRLSKRWITFHREHQLKPIRLHDLRHTNISWQIYKKVHSEAIARRSGHSNTKMLAIYGHVFESVDRAAAAVFDDIMKPKKKRKKKA